MQSIFHRNVRLTFKMKHKDQNIETLLRQTLRKIMPVDGRAILFGSRARGDARSNSDWDILILLNKPKATNEDFDNLGYPLVSLGWENNAEINPLLYSIQDWEKRKMTPFYQNVTKDGIDLWH